MNVLINKVNYCGLTKIITGQYQGCNDLFTIKSSRIPFSRRSMYLSKNAQIRMTNRNEGILVLGGLRFNFEMSSSRSQIKVFDVNNLLIVTFLKYTMYHIDGSWAKVTVTYSCDGILEDFVLGVRLLSSQSLIKSDFNRTKLDKLYVKSYSMDVFESLITWNVLNRYYL